MKKIQVSIIDVSMRNFLKYNPDKIIYEPFISFFPLNQTYFSFLAWTAYRSNNNVSLVQKLN